jgi:UDPglucose 6-dehydrogenase
MSGGMGDGGGCHPRDNIALSWLARKINLSYDLFESIMLCRERQSAFLADILLKKSKELELPVVILGVAFKPETNLTVGSPARLVAKIVEEIGVESFMIDDSVGTELLESKVSTLPGVYLIGCKHARYEQFTFADGSYVVDPHRYINIDDDARYAVHRIGEGMMLL